MLDVVEEIKNFVTTSPLNYLPESGEPFFDEPLVQVADGDDLLFTEYKKIISPNHLTPLEALAKSLNKNPIELPVKLSVISWILPITTQTRKTNRKQDAIPSREWSHTRWFGEMFNDALRKHIIELLGDNGYLAVAPANEPYFSTSVGGKDISNWSERHIAYAAGLGTFSLNDGFITERGIAHRCGSVVTSLVLPASLRTASSPFANCRFYALGHCHRCIKRCPAGSISEKGHDKVRCRAYCFDEIAHLKMEYRVEVTGCGLCQTKVPCEDRNPVRK